MYEEYQQEDPSKRVVQVLVLQTLQQRTSFEEPNSQNIRETPLKRPKRLCLTYLTFARKRKKKSILANRMELEELKQFVREKASLKKWDAEACLRIGAELAVKVNSVQNLTGGEKKKLVVELILQGLREAEEKEKAGKEDTTAIVARYDQLEKVVKETLPVSLELIISASRGKLNLKKIKPSVWMRFCSCFVKGVVTVLVSQKVISEEQAKKAVEVVDKVEDKAGAALDAKFGAEAETEVKEEEMKVNPMLVVRSPSEPSSQVSKEETPSQEQDKSQ